MQYLIPYLDFVTDGDYEENMQNGYNSVVAAPRQHYHRNYRNDSLQLIQGNNSGIQVVWLLG